MVYLTPYIIQAFHYEGPMINIQNDRLNVYGTPGVSLINVSQPSSPHLVSLDDIDVSRQYLFKTTTGAQTQLSTPQHNAPPCVFSTDDSSSADLYSLKHISEGKHVSITLDSHMNKRIYHVASYSTDVPYKGNSDKSDFIYLNRSYNTVFYISFESSPSIVTSPSLSLSVPFLTRRYGKSAWVVISR